MNIVVKQSCRMTVWLIWHGEVFYICCADNVHRTPVDINEHLFIVSIYDNLAVLAKLFSPRFAKAVFNQSLHDGRGTALAKSHAHLITIAGQNVDVKPSPRFFQLAHQE